MSHFSPPRMLAEFHEQFYGEPFGTANANDATLRKRLHREETKELIDALEAGNLVGIAQELADIVYVAYGTAHVLGIPLNRIIGIVHRANMTKLDDEGKPIFDADGKLLKGPNYEPPDIEGILRSFMRDYGRTKTCEVCGAVFHKTSARDWVGWEQRRFCSRECARKGQDRPGTAQRLTCYRDLHSMDEATPEGRANVVRDKRGRRSCRACRAQGDRDRRARYRAAGIKRTDHLKRKTSPAKPAPKPEAVATGSVVKPEAVAVKPAAKPEVPAVPAPPKPEVKPEIPPAPPKSEVPPKPVWRPAGFSAQPRVNVRSRS